MFEKPTRKVLSSIVVVSMSLAIAVQGVYPQCGVYLRRAKTWSYPDTRIYLDHAHDMTGDGLPDLIVSQEGSGWTRTKYLILQNLGNGSFGSTPWATIQAPSGVLNFKYFIANVNGDSRPDILAMMDDSSLPRSFMAFINNGNGTFTAGTYTDNIGYSTRIADINVDGFDDYLGYSGSVFRYSLGNGSGGFAPPVTFLSGDSAEPGDFNGDGKIDLVNNRHLHLNNGDMTFSTIDIQSITTGQSFSAFADFNSDGKLDILGSITTPGPTGFTILYSTGTSFTRTHIPVSGDNTWYGYAIVANWGGSAAPDIAYQSWVSNKYTILINEGNGTFTRSDYGGRLDGMGILAIKKVRADFDNDGKIDLIQASSDISNSHLMFSDVTSFTWLKQVCERTGQSRIVDYDRSNSTDWSFWNPATGDWSSRTRPVLGEQSVVDETINWGLGAHGDIPTPGDFDGDGITDRAVFRNSDGYWYIRRSSDAAWFVLRFGVPGDNPVAADYDGDTISDIAVFRPSEGNWYIWYMGTQTFGAAHWGADGDKPVPADYDGDMKTDLAIYRPSEGAWYYYKSTDGGFGVVQWGISTDRPIPADFDGDGKADIVVHRDSDHIAYMLLSSTSTPRYYQWGLTGDVLQVGDYDGDFVADLAVYRPSNRSWWTTTIPPWGLFVYGVDGAIPTSSLVKAN